MIRALFIDFDGVLRIWGHDHDLRAEHVSGLPPGTIRRVAFAPELLLPAITGSVSDAAWRTAIEQQLRLRFPHADAAQAVQLWSEPVGSIDQAMLDLVRTCRRRIKIILLTNATSRLAHDLERLGVADAFDQIVNSSDVGVGKPNAAIFQAALHTAQVAAAETLYVDDTSSHVTAATQVGIIGYVYAGVERLRAVLQQHGVLEPREERSAHG